ncbi:MULTISPECIES: NUDIX hydrolase [Bacillus cereus group]|uniref:Mutator mutT protein n=1 Tax=Bacillus thuringiensis TaxID=1428 RepID=A0A1C4F556_BACTU|nr:MULTISPECIES: NUDIX domain-containing protein [Bacillus cereus group]MCC2324709.1 NUDIX domain-containing protein [Bacillus wiedmannii]MED3024761.1 NUDIX domain-containing protein [Bacillus wiedmannii]OTY00300.1 DNA mismatch repair protein MutT [Bacillus thuringiensis serovar wratislaviensis]OUB60322.1 DNA mismatch repair protein MutT [Bacillus thuringiensis serovar sylvestriensis]TKI15027.1 NUDIX domain-containing protein [Bacillus wiedmannii]
MIRNRGAAIIVQEGKIVLIKRIREGEIYYVFPGGGIEEGETAEEATKREAYEELGVHIKVEHLIAKVEYKGTEYYFNAHIVGGVFGSGKAEEFEMKDRGSYIPLWLPIHELEKVNIKPYEVVGSICNHYKK